jgi:hypothetical protein
MITLHSHRLHVGPPQGPGKYSDDGQQWLDEASGKWLPVVEGQDTLCIQLEDVHATSLRAAVIARLPHHAAPTSRFVGHATSVDPRWRTYEVASATFPRQSADTAERRGSWPAEMTEALTQLCAQLEAAGWSRVGCGGHPWAWRYSRPRVGWPSAAASSPATAGATNA